MQLEINNSIFGHTVLIFYKGIVTGIAIIFGYHLKPGYWEIKMKICYSIMSIVAYYSTRESKNNKNKRSKVYFLRAGNSCDVSDL